MFGWQDVVVTLVLGGAILFLASQYARKRKSGCDKCVSGPRVDKRTKSSLFPERHTDSNPGRRATHDDRSVSAG